MTMPDFIDPAAFTDDLHQILVVLRNGRISGIAEMTALEIAERLKSAHGLNLHWRSINSCLLANPGLTHRKKRNGRWSFSILRSGEQQVAAPPSATLFIDPAKAVQAVLTLHGLLSHCRGTIRVCDPYLDGTTLQHLDACSTATEIRLLTRNIKDSGPLRALYAAFRTQGKNLQIRVAGANILHDRYIIDDAGMKILGTSLNGFGKKQCFIIEAGGDMRDAMMNVFDGNWANASLWP